MTIAIAMWSGPRNISTAMMRAWENRPDCCVIDEPFYACYLHETGLQHPCREAILKAQPIKRSDVVSKLLAPRQQPVFYQKHMTHHMPEGCDLSWAKPLRHAFLIRDPAEVIASYLQKMPTVTEADIGISRQRALFDEITELTGRRPPVIDSNDVLRAPEATLQALCEALEVPWQANVMTQWPAGGRDSDGVWADHWYESVRASRGFAPVSARSARACDLPADAQALAEAMKPHYDAMAAERLSTA